MTLPLLRAGRRSGATSSSGLLAALAAEPDPPTTSRARRRPPIATSPTAWPGSRSRRCAGRSAIADIGSGAGFPGLPLAVALPAARVDLVEATASQVRVHRAPDRGGGIANARAVPARAEEWAAGEGREAYDAVTARALALAGGARRVRGAAADARRRRSWPGRGAATRTSEAAGSRRGRGDRRSRPPQVRAVRSVRRRRAPPSARLSEGWAHARALPAAPRHGAQAPAGRPRRPSLARAKEFAVRPRITSDRRSQFRPHPALPSRANGHRLRDRQPEGRRRKDDDRGQRCRLRGGGRLRDAAGRPRPAVQRDGRARPGQGPRAVDLRLPERRARRSPRPLRRAASTGCRSSRPRRDLAGATSSSRGCRASSCACATGSRACASASCSHCSTARRRSARSPSTRWSPPTRSSCRCRPSTSRSRGWRACSTRSRSSSAS